MSWPADIATLWTYVECPFHALTGLYCPLCGSTRALLALLHGDVFLAARCNLVLVAAVLWTAGIAGRRLLDGQLVARDSSPAERGVSQVKRRRWVLVIVVLIFTVVRNTFGAWWLTP